MPVEWMGIILIELNYMHQVAIMNHRREEEIPYFIFWICIKTEISNVRHLETYTQKHRQQVGYFSHTTHIHMEFT